MSDRQIAIWGLVFGALSLFAALFFGLRAEGLLRFEEWTWDINKAITLLGSLSSIIGVATSGIFFKRNKRAVEAEREAKEEAERKAKEEAERKAKEEAEQKAKEEAEQKAKEEAERKAKEEAERKAKEKAEQKVKEEEDNEEEDNEEEDNEEASDVMVRIGTSFLASVVSFVGGKYLVSVKYCGDNSIMVKEVKMLEGDICSISNVNELKNIYLTDGRGFDVQLKRNTYSKEHKSCILIQCDYPEKILFDVNSVKILNNERDKV